MDIIDTIRTRRSIREYKEKLPGDAEITGILEAAQWAPSGLNNQPWRFQVIKDVKKNGLAKFTKYGDTIKEAPVAIAVFMNAADSYNRDKDLMAIGASIQNMMLEAHSLGLGTCWLGEVLNRKSEVEKYLGAGEGLELMALVTVGYPDETIAEGERKPLSKIVI